MKRGCLFISLLLCTVLALPAAEKNLTSVNLHWAKDYMTPIFADAMMTRRIFEKPTYNSGAATLDANGWPSEDFGVVVWHGYKHRSGVYTLYFDGKADVSAEWSSPVFRNKVYDPENNKTTVELYYASPPSQLRLKFTNTINGVRNLKLMRPIEESSQVSHPVTETFDRNLKAVVSRFDVIRYMDPTETNSSPQVAWEDRNLTHQSQSAGMSWEYVIQLSNETNTDPWINIPHKANDDYITQLAMLFRDRPLDPERKLYVEYSNEVWNTGPGFSQGGWNGDEAVRCVVENEGHPLNYDKAFTSDNAAGNKWTLAKRRIPYKGMEVSDIFRSVFGDEEMMVRVRPLFCWQASSNGMNDWGLSGFNFIDGYLRKEQQRSVNNVFWGAGPAGYYSPASDVTVDNIWNSNDFNHEYWANRSCKYDATMCAAFGLHYVLYEGGPGFGDALGGSGSNPIGDIVWNDPRIYDEMIDHHRAYNKMGGELFCYYVLNHDYRWKFITTVDSADTYKMKAIDDLRTADRDACTLGRQLPLTVKGGDFDVHKVGWKLNNSGQHDRTRAYTLPASEWVGYNLLRTTDGDMAITIRYKSSSAGNLLVYAGGTLLSDIQVTSSPNVQAAPKMALNIPKGTLFGIRLLNNGTAGISIEDIEIKSEQLYQLALVSDPESAAKKLTGAGNHLLGSSVLLGATANDGFAFAGWYDGETLLSSQAGYSYNVTGTKTLTAKFTAIPTYRLTLEADPEDATSNFSGAGDYFSGTLVPVDVTANESYLFEGWYDGEILLSGQSGFNYTLIEDKLLTAKFTLNISVEKTDILDDVELSQNNKTLKINFKNDFRGQVNITDARGILLASKDVRSAPEITLPLHAYPAGVYLLEVRSGIKKQVFKFVLE